MGDDNPISFSCAVLHDATRQERADALEEMLAELLPPGRAVPPVHIITDRRPEGMPWAQFKTVLALRQWEWALSTGASHHVFLTDDLNLAPNFWGILGAMVEGGGHSHIIGLLSNHPMASYLAASNHRWYRCNSWIVGPAYVVPDAHLRAFVEWYKALPDNEEPKGRRWFNDDSALNEWITYCGPRESWHPLPTIIEHRADVASTVGHGDRYSRERISWRAERIVVIRNGAEQWDSWPALFSLDHMARPAYWRLHEESMLPRMLPVGEGE